MDDEDVRDDEDGAPEFLSADPLAASADAGWPEGDRKRLPGGIDFLGSGVNDEP